MKKIELIATTTFGLEAVVKRELNQLGYQELKVENGHIAFWGEPHDIARCNLWLRSAERVLLKLGSFEARTFTELFDQTRALPWEDWISEHGKFTVKGRSIRSTLFSVPDCQAIVKKAVVERLKETYQRDWFKEIGPDFTIEVALLKDVATLTIDTSGAGLHKRGYRTETVEAPIKETLAAALVQLSYWRPERVLLDPLCGSGTIAIEAAMLGKNIAPGLQRSFASEAWPCLGKTLWRELRRDALQAINQETTLHILASDLDGNAIAAAEENAFNAGVDDCISFKVANVAHIQPTQEYGVIITNPPYGERIGEAQEVADLYRSMGRVFRQLPTWSKYVITSHPEFEQLLGNRADKKRKLYNGNIKVNYYQYFGPRPPRA